MAWVVIVWIISAIVGWKIGVYKGNAVAGLVFGLVLGVLGVVIIALIPQSDQARVGRAERRMRVEREAPCRLGQEPPQQTA